MTAMLSSIGVQYTVYCMVYCLYRKDTLLLKKETIPDIHMIFKRQVSPINPTKCLYEEGMTCYLDSLVKSRGPGTEPLGTPEVTGKAADEKDFI